MTPNICKFKTWGKVSCSIGGVLSPTKCGFNPASCETLINRGGVFWGFPQIDPGLLEIIEAYCRGGKLAGYPISPGHLINVAIINFLNDTFDEEGGFDSFVDGVVQGGMTREGVLAKLGTAGKEEEETLNLLQAHLNMAERKK